VKNIVTIVHNYDRLLGYGFTRLLENHSLTPQPNESSWNFRKRAFIDICLEMHSIRLAMAFLLLLKHADWSEKDRKKYKKLLNIEKPTKEDLQRFVKTYRKDPVVARDFSFPTDKRYLKLQEIEFTLPKVPLKKKERIAQLVQKDYEVQRDIVEAIAGHFGVSLDDILSHHRNREVVLARHIAEYILRENGLSFLNIGRLMNKDHTTMVHAHKKFCEKMKTDKEISRIVSKINAELAKNSP
jgi:signal recognition particle subunit SEC65